MDDRNVINSRTDKLILGDVTCHQLGPIVICKTDGWGSSFPNFGNTGGDCAHYVLATQ
jgi:hypothetical protein